MEIFKEMFINFSWTLQMTEMGMSRLNTDSTVIESVANKQCPREVLAHVL
jgi:hypothetical protein